MSTVLYKTAQVDSVKVFYRDVGDPSLPGLLLLHGHASASHTFRNLLPLLSDSFHIIAPDLPGFGNSDMPSRETYKYNFVNLSATIGKFTEVIGLNRFAIYVFDYGAPVGFYIALKNPERITGIVSQSGNAYEEGIGPGFDPIKAWWADPTNDTHREGLKSIFSNETIKWAYTHGVENPELLDLLLDYENNLKAYPSWQAYLRKHKPKVVALWGKDDPFFAPAGAEAFKRDIPDAYVEIVDSGHFLNESMPGKVAEIIRKLL